MWNSHNMHRNPHTDSITYTHTQSGTHWTYRGTDTYMPSFTHIQRFLPQTHAACTADCSALWASVTMSMAVLVAHTT